MGLGRELPWLLLVALCAAAAGGVASYAIGASSINVLQIAAALIALAIGQVILFLRFSFRSAKSDLDLRRMAHEYANLMRETREERRVAADLSAQVSVMRTENQAFTNSIVAGINDLRQSHAHLADNMRMMMSRPVEPLRRVPMAVHPQQWQQDQPAEATYLPPLPANPELAAPAPVNFDATAYADSLVLSLEPVIDLFSGQTAHYRLHYAMSSDTGDTVAQEKLNHFADRADLRPGLDIHLAREAMGLLSRLRRRDAKLGLLLPIGAATLSVREALQHIVDIRSEDPAIGEGLVVDLPHAVLASLPESAIEGLAFLARSGIELSLSNASVSGLDLSSLDKLNVRFVGVSAASVGAEPKMSKGIAGFVQAARALGINVIVAGVASAQQATQLMRVARFASGPAFAEPRRVRRNASPASAELNGQAEYSAAAE
jgi:EAL domain-containing protein (putative c-di-GMP-specific phosphodiesterase class I)